MINISADVGNGDCGVAYSVAFVNQVFDGVVYQLFSF